MQTLQQELQFALQLAVVCFGLIMQGRSENTATLVSVNDIKLGRNESIEL
jgi:hypothetical protein